MRRKVGPLCLSPERFPMFPVSLSVLIRRTTLAVSASTNSTITATIRSLSARIARIAAATSAMKPSSGQNASGVMLPDFLFADNVRRLGQMNHRFRKTALFAVFFLLRGVALPIRWAGGTDRKAGTPQIKTAQATLSCLILHLLMVRLHLLHLSMHL